MERGKSYLTEYSVTGSVSDYLITGGIKKDIVAYAGILNINYYIDVLLKPVFMVQYAFGSGDVNRSDYRSTGNTWGKDRGFIYFGTFVGGYALKPILANMHVISGSVSFSPFSWVKLSYVKNMTLIAKYLYYLKYKDFSPINYGLDATRPDRDIGHGFDLSLRWLIFSDFSFFLNYGLFVPGKAFGYYYDYQSAQSIVKQIGYYGSAIFGSLNNYPLNKITYSSTAYRHFVMGGFNTSF
jgi:hypothetical protein